MRFVLGLLLISCDAGTAPAPVEPARVAPRDAATVVDPFAACTILPQPSKPGHTSVEPDDMICTHGDSPYACPKGFDGAAHGCRASTSSAWCCPQQSPR